ncbi:hypothetical protein RQP46_004980 [Phenoliferia psychrophenolica]
MDPIAFPHTTTTNWAPPPAAGSPPLSHFPHHEHGLFYPVYEGRDGTEYVQPHFVPHRYEEPVPSPYLIAPLDSFYAQDESEQPQSASSRHANHHHHLGMESASSDSDQSEYSPFVKKNKSKTRPIARKPLKKQVPAPIRATLPHVYDLDDVERKHAAQSAQVQVRSVRSTSSSSYPDMEDYEEDRSVTLARGDSEYVEEESSSDDEPLLKKAPRTRPFRPVPRTNFKSCREQRFIEKVFAMLNAPEQYGDVIRWDSTGEHIMIAHKELRLKDVLHEQFRHSTFSAFGRQFAVYGFRALTLKEIETLVPDGETRASYTRVNTRKPCRAWTHKVHGTFTRATTDAEVAEIVAIPSAARRAAAAKREAEIDRRRTAWQAPQGRAADQEWYC